MTRAVLVPPSTVVVTAAIGSISSLGAPDEVGGERAGPRRDDRQVGVDAGHHVAHVIAGDARHRRAVDLGHAAVDGDHPDAGFAFDGDATGEPQRQRLVPGRGRPDREGAVAPRIEPEPHRGVADRRAGDGRVATGPPRHRDLGERRTVGAIGYLTATQVAHLHAGDVEDGPGLPGVRGERLRPVAGPRCRDEGAFGVGVSQLAELLVEQRGGVVRHRDDPVGSRGLPGALPEEQRRGQHDQERSGRQVRRQPARVSQPVRLCCTR